MAPGTDGEPQDTQQQHARGAAGADPLQAIHWPQIAAYFRNGGWPAAALYVAIALGVLGILLLVLRKIAASHLTVGAVLVMLMYGALAFFVLLATRLFVDSRDDQRPS